MSSDAHHGGTGDRGILDSVSAAHYEVLRHPRRVRLLDILSDRAPLSLTELTTELVDREDADVSEGAARYDVHVSLVHNHLPRLEAHGLVDWDHDSDDVDLVDEPQLCPAALSTLLETDANADETELLERIVDPARLQLIETVAETDRSQSIDQLAASIAALESDTTPALPSEQRRAKIALHHAHLPALDEIDVLEYDVEAKLVSPTDTTESASLVR